MTELCCGAQAQQRDLWGSVGLVVAHSHAVRVTHVGADDVHGRAHVPLHIEQVDAQGVGQALRWLAAIEHLRPRLAVMGGPEELVACLPTLSSNLNMRSGPKLPVFKLAARTA